MGVDASLEAQIYAGSFQNTELTDATSLYQCAFGVGYRIRRCSPSLLPPLHSFILL
jgi:hypothetical protein